MDIYVVQSGDTVESIANKFEITVERLISDNGLINPNTLVPGQAIVILYPKQTYIVKQGDTLANIAEINNISLMQLLRNNPFLYDREFFYPGETLVISYQAEKEITTNGYAFSFINRDVLKRELPYLTFISIFNYSIGDDANVIVYGDDSDIIKISKDYQVIPLLMISAFSPTGELDLETVYDLLLNEEKQNKLVDEMLKIVRTRGFSGINSLISNLNESNQRLYLNVFTKISKALRNEGYLFMVTINPNLNENNGSLLYKNIDYYSLSLIADRIIFLNSIWGINYQPPSPISNISLIRPFLDYITDIISPSIISIGKPLIGYDWTLPFTPGSSFARALSLNSVITLAYDQRVVIQLDEESQTPYFNYISSQVGALENHIVWFIDARSINALDDVIAEYNLVGTGLWNLTSFNQQLFSIINARFIITKFSFK